MPTTKKSVKKVSKRVIVKKDVCPCGCGADCPCHHGGECGCGCGASVKYTGVWAAWHAFWRRGFCEWGGTSSRSEYWLAWIGNLIVFILGSIVVAGVSLLETSVMGHAGLFSALAVIILAIYAVAWIIPAISMMTRRMHDAGLSAWVWVLYIFSMAPAWTGDLWVYAPAVGLIVALLPTQTHNNPYQKNNK